MSDVRSGGDLFVVDNSDAGWTGLRYLQEWCQLAKAFDIATGFFDTGALVALDGSWQKLGKIRILMGTDVVAGTRRQLLEATKARAERVLDEGLETDKVESPFLTGVASIKEAIISGQIEIRVYDRAKFHAKAYITHPSLEVVGSKALVGSSNFTRPGLTQNVELNVQIQNSGDVAQLQAWFEEYWQQGVEVRDDVLRVIERQIRPYSPFEVYAQALHQYFSGHELTASEWEEGSSTMFARLDRYQKEAYWALMKIAGQHNGAFLCDGVGLGKTFVGLMLIERMVVHERQRVLLLAPKGAKESVWEPHLDEYLPKIGGAGSRVDFSNLSVLAHTDFTRRGQDYPERIANLAESADVVIIDEAHHFRNPGRRPVAGDPSKTSRYYKLFDLLDPGRNPKTVFLLTATPINNRLTDFRHMIELFSRQDDSYFARSLGINNLKSHFGRLEANLNSKLDEREETADDIEQASELLAGDAIFRGLVVQRSRAYAIESQRRETGNSAMFPVREDPRVADYSVRKTYGVLLDMLEAAFGREDPLFKLPVYYPLAYYRGTDKTIDPFEENRQKQVVSLIRTQFLKRFESSVRAFDQSCFRLMLKLQAFIEKNGAAADRDGLERWRRIHADVLNHYQKVFRELWDEQGDDDEEEDLIPQEFLEAFETLPRDEYDVDTIIKETFLDLEQIMQFLAETRRFTAKQDDKLRRLKELLKSQELADKKVLIFTEFADTARYLYDELSKDGIAGLAELDSMRGGNRKDVITRFAPYYNKSSSEQLKKERKDEIRVLISTDVLSEGLNLQDATRLINYDIHWNPVRLMQRIGRVDRRLNPDVETRLKADHPSLADTRGKVIYWNFLPPNDLNEILTLYRRVTGKTLLISETLGIEGRKLLRPEDHYNALREFNEAYEGSRTALENMHLEYQSLLLEYPGIVDRLDGFPRSVFSGREHPSKGASAVFFCYRLPAYNPAADEYTDEAGTTAWYLYDLSTGKVEDDAAPIAEVIRSGPDVPRRCEMSGESLLEIRKKVEKHITNTYLKRVNAPISVAPTLRCWMELGS